MASARRGRSSENCYKLHSCCGHTHTAIDLRARVSGAPSVAGRGRGSRRGRGRDLRAGLRNREGGGAADAVPGQVQPGILRRGGAGRRPGRAGAVRRRAVWAEDGATMPGSGHCSSGSGCRSTRSSPPGIRREWGTRIRFTRRRRQRRSWRAAFSEGNPENPVSTALLEDKFRDLVGSATRAPSGRPRYPRRSHDGGLRRHGGRGFRRSWRPGSDSAATSGDVNR